MKDKFLIHNLSSIGQVNDEDELVIERDGISYKVPFSNFDHLQNLSVETAKINNLTVDGHGDIIDFINSSIEHNAAFYVSKNERGDPFINYAELSTATNSLSNESSADWNIFIGGIRKRPSQNDYCVVLSDETLPDDYKGKDLSIQYSTRYSWSDTQRPELGLSGYWEFKYIINNSPYTEVQWAAINSGVTKEWKEEQSRKEDWTFVLEDGVTEVKKTVFCYDITQ